MTSTLSPRLRLLLPRAALIGGCLMLSMQLPVNIPPALAQAPGGAPAVPVTVSAAVARDVPVVVRGIGAVQASQTAAIRTRVDGALEEVFFTEGQEVKRGDLLARIDPRPYQAVLDQVLARKAANAAALANARLNLARSIDLARNQFAARQVVDTRAAEVAQLEAQLKADDAAISAAQVNFDYTSITAPFDGRVGLRQVDPGNLLRFADNAATAIVTLSQIRPVAVLFTLPQDTLPAVQAAMARGRVPVTALTSDEGRTLGEGALLTTDSAIDAATGTIRMKASFPNEDTRMWPGQFVTVQMQLEVLPGVLTVPSVAVQRSPDGPYVYVVKDDQTVQLVRVELGHDNSAVAVLRRGVEAGARVVVAGHSRLRPGAKVTVAPPPQAPTSTAPARPSG